MTLLKDLYDLVPYVVALMLLAVLIWSDRGWRWVRQRARWVVIGGMLVGLVVYCVVQVWWLR